MERRKFIKTASVASACTLASTVLPENLAAVQAGSNRECRITVLKRTLNNDWSKKFRNTDSELCNRFEDGQEFILQSPWLMPDKFCHWAWADIRIFIHLVDSGRFDKFVACCTDGFRPVFFLIERIQV